MKTLRLLCAATAALAILAMTACQKEDTSYLNGYVEGDYIRVAAPFAGRLVKRPVMRGDQITPGSPLFTLNTDDELASRNEAAARVTAAEARLADLKKGQRPEEIAALDASLRQAQAALDLSSAELKRVEPLVRNKALAAADLDQARSNEHRDQARVAELGAQISAARLGGRTDAIDAAAAELKAAQDQLAGADWRLQEKTQTSPVAARVEDTLYEPGEWVPAGTPVLSLLPPANVKVRFYVPEGRLAQVTKGARVTLQMDGSPTPVEAVVSFVASQAEYTPPVIYSRETREKLVFLCEARPQLAEAGKLHPGQPVEVRFP